MGLQFPLSFGRQNISKSWHLLDIQVLVWPATAGQVSVAGLPLWLSTGMGPSSAAMESSLSMASARRRDLLRPSLRLRPTMAMEDTVGMALAMEAMAMGVLDTVMARGLLTLRLMPTTAMEDMDLGMALAMEDTAMVVLATVMARGPLMPSLTMVDTVGPTLVLDTATAAMVALSVDTATWDKECQRLLQGTATNGICSIFRIMKNYRY